MGLTLCRRIVELHGGRIWLDTGHETGSRFCFSLRARPIDVMDDPLTGELSVT